ncbi:peptidoglycan-associated lipoprotein Pal [Limibacillus halophilus]|jgi:peptidoglycan-associated lipoprotein
MRYKLLSIFAALLLLTACETSSMEGDASGSGSSGTTAGPVPGSQEDLVVNVGDRVFFGFDEYTLTAEGRGTLDRVAAWMQANPSVTVSIEGHADERGTREYNLALGERRASAALNYVAALGVNPSRMTTVSYGEERPAVIGSDEAAWAQNRRAVFVVIN